MKVDFSTILKDAKGTSAQRLIVKPAYRLDDGSIEPPLVEDMTLMALALDALQQPGGENTVKPKWDLFGLLVRIAQGGEVELTAKEATTILEAIAKNYVSPMPLGRAKQLLDPEAPATLPA